MPRSMFIDQGIQKVAKSELFRTKLNLISIETAQLCHEKE